MRMQSQFAEHWESFRVTALGKCVGHASENNPQKYSTLNFNDQIVQKGFKNDLSS